MTKDGTCRICGRTLKNNDKMGNQQHSGKHCREFEEETGYSKHTDYELIVAYYSPENAAKWAVEIMDALKEADKIPKGTNLTDFDDLEDYEKVTVKIGEREFEAKGIDVEFIGGHRVIPSEEASVYPEFSITEDWNFDGEG